MVWVGNCNQPKFKHYIRSFDVFHTTSQTSERGKGEEANGISYIDLEIETTTFDAGTFYT